MTYGGAVPAITPVYSGLVAGDTAASLTTPPACSTAATSTSPVGSYSSTCSGAVDPNYDISYTSGSVAVGTTILVITATSATMSYGGAVPEIAPGYAGFVNGDTPASLTAPPACSTAASSSSPPGTYSSTCSGAVDANYAIGYVAGTVSVAAAPLVITANSTTMTYGGTVPAITAGYAGFVNGDTTASLTTPPACSTTATGSSPPGIYPATCSGAVDANYDVSYVVGSVSVTAAPLVITADSATVTFGEPIPSLPATYAGFVNGDTAASLTTPPACSTTATGSSPPGTYPATCSGAVDANYDISYGAGTVTIVAAPSSAPPGTTTTTTGTAPPGKVFPDANVSYPNGAIVRFQGSSYVFAGGRAFAVGNSLAAMEKVDHAKVLPVPAGVVVPTAAALRPGTLLSTRAINGDPAIYVSGTDGKLHGFSTSRQLSRDGYDAALVVTVPSLKGTRVGASVGAEGATVTALATRADGAIVDSSGTFYVFAGGRAFGIPSATALAAVRAADKATPVKGPIGTTQTTAFVARGVLLSDPGKVYVSYQGDLYQLKTKAQLVADGYGGTAAVPAPGHGTLNVVSLYSGS